jgi:hypothetical protein
MFVIIFGCKSNKCDYNKITSHKDGTTKISLPYLVVITDVNSKKTIQVLELNKPSNLTYLLV